VTAMGVVIGAAESLDPPRARVTGPYPLVIPEDR
jgi:hypothetical protein